MTVAQQLPLASRRMLWTFGRWGTGTETGDGNVFFFLKGRARRGAILQIWPEIHVKNSRSLEWFFFWQFYIVVYTGKRFSKSTFIRFDRAYRVVRVVQLFYHKNTCIFNSKSIKIVCRSETSRRHDRDGFVDLQVINNLRKKKKLTTKKLFFF